jgi:hypothetical protein
MTAWPVALWLSVGILLGGCNKVNVTRLGSTKDGRQQFELTCGERASSSGACHQEAVAACGGDYETLDIANTGPRPVASQGQLSGQPGYRVLLIACNR